MNKVAWLLLALGLVQMAGELLTAVGATSIGPAVKGIGAASTASPAPKVFTAHRGLETFSTKFAIEWDDRAGVKHSKVITSEDYQRIRGPYNRRNVYGAVLAYGPVLQTTEATRPMFESAKRFALTGNAPLLVELGIDPAQVAGGLRVRYEPRPDAPIGDWPRVIEVTQE